MAKRTQTKEAPALTTFDAFNAAVKTVLDYGPPKKVKERRDRKRGRARARNPDR